LILQIHYTIPDREKQGKNNKKINYFGQLLKNTFYEIINDDELVKSRKVDFSVIPAKLVPAGFKPGAGIQLFQPIIKPLDSGFHRSDGFLGNHQ